MITCAVLQVSMVRRSERQRIGMRRARRDLITIDIPANAFPVRKVRRRCTNVHPAVRQQARRDRFG